MQPDFIYYQIRERESTFTDFVESFWLLTNRSDKANNIVVLPDGRVDIMFSMSPTETFHASLIGVESKAKQVVFQADTTIFAVSLKLPAVELLFDAGVAALLDSARVLPEGLWNIQPDDLLDFDSFCAKLNEQLSHVFSPVQHDPRIVGHLPHRKEACCLEQVSYLYPRPAAESMGAPNRKRRLA